MIDGNRVKTTKEMVSQKAYTEIFNKDILPKGTLLMSFKLTIGKVSILDIDSFHNEAIISIFPYFDEKNIIRDYLFKVLPLISNFGNTKNAIKGKTLNSKSINKLLIPITNLKELKKIINKILSLEFLLKRYNEKYIKLAILNSNYKEELKKSILQYAIQGKLVKQEPNDEAADVLINKILDEKRELIKSKQIKKENLSVIYKDSTDNQFYEKFDDETIKNITDEIPFEIPDNWAWTRVKNVGLLQTGATPSTMKKNFFGTDIPFIKPGDIFFNKIVYNNEGLTFEGAKHSRLASENSILMVCIGGSIGKAFYTNRNVCFNQQINAITPIILDYKYLYYIMISEYFYKLLKNNSSGTATPIVNKSLFGEILIPIAPIKEQNKISNKINNIIYYIKTAE